MISNHFFSPNFFLTSTISEWQRCGLALYCTEIAGCFLIKFGLWPRYFKQVYYGTPDSWFPSDSNRSGSSGEQSIRWICFVINRGELFRGIKNSISYKCLKIELSGLRKLRRRPVRRTYSRAQKGRKFERRLKMETWLYTGEKPQD